MNAHSGKLPKQLLSDDARQPSTIPKIMLAPMEGVLDAGKRELLTGFGGYDRCVTEFVRVSDSCLPDRVYYRYCPELKQGGITATGVPVYVQLLGSDPCLMARNAARAARLGAVGIDLNFGCPAKTVNRSQGGAVLLDHPDILANVVDAVRQAVPADIPVTAKMRLGYECGEVALLNAQNIESAGATELCIHARTKSDGYKPPAYWQQVRPITELLKIPVTINGEIWTPQNATRALQESGADNLMLGRGALARPDLGNLCRSHLLSQTTTAVSWGHIAAYLLDEFDETDCVVPRRTGNRTKQWLNYLKRTYPEAGELFQTIRRSHERPVIRNAIQASITA